MTDSTVLRLVELFGNRAPGWLRDKGVISAEDFEQRKQRLLDPSTARAWWNLG